MHSILFITIKCNATRAMQATIATTKIYKHSSESLLYTVRIVSICIKTRGDFFIRVFRLLAAT